MESTIALERMATMAQLIDATIISWGIALMVQQMDAAARKQRHSTMTTASDGFAQLQSLRIQQRYLPIPSTTNDGCDGKAGCWCKQPSTTHICMEDSSVLWSASSGACKGKRGPLQGIQFGTASTGFGIGEQDQCCPLLWLEVNARAEPEEGERNDPSARFS
mmetsp:Transcript_8303/g.51727  ORF Transcript_8303/g.51727 Transcript_8303/m.51727 type:complete len:162 (-) Transcript_8303:2401-2886(-)